MEGPVDYTDLRTEFIGLIYEGLLDYRLKRTDEQTGPQIVLDFARQLDETAEALAAFHRATPPCGGAVPKV